LLRCMSPEMARCVSSRQSIIRQKPSVDRTSSGQQYRHKADTGVATLPVIVQDHFRVRARLPRFKGALGSIDKDIGDR
jgi:hypothetical protein